MSVEFVPTGNGRTTVKIDGLVKGEIRKIKSKDPKVMVFQYVAKGQKPERETFPTLSLCKYSLL